MNSSSASDSPQISRRQIREATVQLLHATGGITDETSDPWPLILAPAESKIIRVRARAILHLQQNRAHRLKLLNEKKREFYSLIENYLEDRSAARTFRSLLKTEEEILSFLDLLRRQLKSDKEPETIAENLERIQENNLNSLAHQKTLSEAIGPETSSPAPLKPLAQALPPLLTTSELLRSLFSQNLPNTPETQALRKAIAERELLQIETAKLHELIAKHQKEINQLISKHLENFTFERLAQVDRAVLQLATTELKHCPDIPPAVSINEAIDIARRFGGSDSALFVNGVLDKLGGNPSSAE